MLDIFQVRARTFSFAARFLPADRRAAVSGLYTFARAIDDLVDEPPASLTRDDILRLLADWRDWLDRPTLLTAPDRRLAVSVTPVIRWHGVPPAYLQMLVDGVASDLTRAEVRSWPDLRAYCVLVASSVGLAMCHLLGAGDDPLARQAAIDLGIGMQLTNILRDIGVDLRDGRVYLPSDELARYGFDRNELANLASRVAEHGPLALDARFRQLMQSQIARARVHYARGLTGIARLPADCRLPILLAARLYAAILDDIETAAYDVFTRRAATSTRFKLAEAVRCAVLLRARSRSSATAFEGRRPASHAVGVQDGLRLVNP